MAFSVSFLIVLGLICRNVGLTYSKSQLIRLDEDNWSDMLTGEWLVEFYAPWCPACKALQPLWEEFSTWSKDLGVSVAQVDITNSPGLSGRFMVTALPTIFHVINGEFRRYTGSRDRESFMSFVEDQKWKTVEPISNWKYPSSVQMSIVAYFFKLSQGLRLIHNTLTIEYGLPQWGSYLIFALVTIFLGALLGMIMVCLIDYIWPPKLPQKSPKGKSEKGGGDDVAEESDEADEEIPEEDLIDEQATETNAIRKRKARKAD
ncbi:thioredoxin-related transmembrane protein 1-like [Cimex lectularius]|uniref:Thioredoxin-related transmembrane protein 1 n=1 Tax=Cimex lectularius TaxID=79782 RepID=A0A8I6RUN1_CIMLE|nr:thioredoxin-related transmembrane protein 1-like [Cimex lectularius]XP_014251716.1 thioredoxin-related transmembrane protein 1-like [Cimex lectularius]